LTAQAASLKETVERLSEMVGVRAESRAQSGVMANLAAKASAPGSREEGRRQFPLNESELN